MGWLADSSNRSVKVITMIKEVGGMVPRRGKRKVSGKLSVEVDVGGESQKRVRGEGSVRSQALHSRFPYL